MWGERPGWGSDVPELGCVVVEHLPEESLKPPDILLPFPGVARGKRMPRRAALALEGARRVIHQRVQLCRKDSSHPQSPQSWGCAWRMAFQLLTVALFSVDA